MPVFHGVVVPARQAYSHSASVGGRSGMASIFFGRLKNEKSLSHIEISYQFLGRLQVKSDAIDYPHRPSLISILSALMDRHR